VAPDGSWLASASNDQTVRVWDPVTGQARHTLAGHTGAVVALVVAPDGSWLASASNDQTVRIWSLGTARCNMSLRTGHPLEHLAIAGECIAAAGDCGPYFWVKAQPLHETDYTLTAGGTAG